MTIERLRELHDHASSEPWRVSTEDRARILWSSGGYLGSMRSTAHPAAENAGLVVAMRNALPALLDVAAAALEVCDPMVADGGGDRWWKAHEDLRAALDALEQQS